MADQDIYKSLTQLGGKTELPASPEDMKNTIRIALGLALVAALGACQSQPKARILEAGEGDLVGGTKAGA